MTTWTDATEAAPDFAVKSEQYVVSGYVVDDYIVGTYGSAWTQATEAGSWSNVSEGSPTWTNASEAGTSWT